MEEHANKRRWPGGSLQTDLGASSRNIDTWTLRKTNMDLELQLGLTGLSHVTIGYEKILVRLKSVFEQPMAMLVISRFPKLRSNNFEHLKA